MQIEQVIGAACADPEAQAIQLRTRSIGQNFVAGTSLVVYDAAGANPITLLTFPGNVGNGSAGTRILVASAQFAADTGQAPDFTLTSLIPTSYFAAGRLTFQGGALIYWSVSWGGSSYTGPNTGQTFNDADGNFGPSFPEALPSSGAEALRFQGNQASASTNNAADYALTSGGAVFTNSAGTSGAPLECSQIFVDGFESGDLSAWSRKKP